MAACVALGAILALGFSPSPAAARGRPNLILINTDDQTLAQLRPDVMPNVTQLFDQQGVEFTDAVTQPLCCPSRAGMLTGQYPHNNGVFNNIQGYRQLEKKGDTLPTWLQRAGYRTGYVGKFLNQYPNARGLEPAPGFSFWFNLLSPAYYGEHFSDNGKEVAFGESGGRNQVDNVETREALGFIRKSARQKRPFFLWLSYLAPHHGAGPHPDECPDPWPVPSPKDLGAFDSEPLPQPPSYNEANVSDKPSFVQDLDPLTGEDKDELTQLWRCSLESLGAADRGVGRINDELERVGEADDTVVVFTSDNGLQFGEHRLRAGKSLPYEESVRVPLLFRGPPRYLGATAPVDIDLPVASIDLAPTFLRLAKATPCSEPDECRTMDGRSLLPLLRGDSGDWPEDRGILFELDHASRQPGNACAFEAIRTPVSAYHQYTEIRDPDTGECLPADVSELYDLSDDPFELENLLFTDPSGSAGVQASLAARLEKLRDCAGIQGRDPRQHGRPHCE